jgi:hypothetical protein
LDKLNGIVWRERRLIQSLLKETGFDSSGPRSAASVPDQFGVARIARFAEDGFDRILPAQAGFFNICPGHGLPIVPERGMRP